MLKFQFPIVYAFRVIIRQRALWTDWVEPGRFIVLNDSASAKMAIKTYFKFFRFFFYFQCTQRKILNFPKSDLPKSDCIYHVLIDLKPN